MVLQLPVRSFIFSHSRGADIADYRFRFQCITCFNVLFCLAPLFSFVSGAIQVSYCDCDLNTTTSIGEAVKTTRTEFENFTIKGRFFQNTQKLLTQFQGLATSGRHHSATITDRRKFTTKLTPSTGCLVSIVIVKINSKSFSWAVIPYKKGTYANFRHL